MRPGLIVIVPRDDAQNEVQAAFERLDRLGLDRQAIGSATLFIDDAASILPFIGAEGALVGTIFDRAGGGRVRVLRSSQCLAIEGADGRYLPENLWGAYVAFWRDRQSNALAVFRDPSGALPLFYCRTKCWDIVFSDLRLAIFSGLLAARVDWAGIAHLLRYRQLPTERTGLETVSELLPGQRIILGAPTPACEMLWSPWTFAPRRGACKPNRPDALADTVARTVAAWGSRYDSIQLELSGGLDSSILASCLAGRSGPWRCATIHTPGADGDERPYAHLMAEAASAPIIDLPVNADDIDLTRRPRRLRPRPSGFGVLDAIDVVAGSAAISFGADAIFSGTGGDNVFCYILSPTPVLDAFRCTGLAQACKTAADIADISGTTSWSVARHALQRAVLDAARPQRWPVTTAFLGNATCPPLELHPWLDRPGDGLCGSRTHIASILRIMPMMDAFDRAVEPGVVFPLMSQPVIEACIAVPSWRWMTGGRDRAAVREAFDSRLPREITGRRSKGRLESAVLPAFARSRPTLLDLLAHGHLVRNGIIDRDAVGEALRKPVSADNFAYTRILELVDAELWVCSILDLDDRDAPRR
ncbi:asparagine synthase (glutamine-hydrolyzing) [Sphingomonas sp. UYAg733]